MTCQREITVLTSPSNRVPQPPSIQVLPPFPYPSADFLPTPSDLLSWAIVCRNYRAAILLIERYRIDVNQAHPWRIARKPEGKSLSRTCIKRSHTTPLQLAAYYGILALVKYLVEQKQADPNICSECNTWYHDDYFRPLDFAIDGGHLHVINYLADKTDLFSDWPEHNLSDSDKETKLYIMKRTITTENLSLVKIYLKDPVIRLYLKTHQSDSEDSLLQLVEETKNPELEELFLEAIAVQSPPTKRHKSED